MAVCPGQASLLQRGRRGKGSTYGEQATNKKRSGTQPQTHSPQKQLYSFKWPGLAGTHRHLVLGWHAQLRQVPLRLLRAPCVASQRVELRRRLEVFSSLIVPISHNGSGPRWGRLHKPGLHVDAHRLPLAWMHTVQSRAPPARPALLSPPPAVRVGGTAPRQQFGERSPAPPVHSGRRLGSCPAAAAVAGGNRCLVGRHVLSR